MKKIVLTLALFVFAVAGIFAKDTVPYSIKGQLSFEDSDKYECCGFTGSFCNKGEAEVTAFTIVFFVFDSDGNSPVVGRNNIVLKIEQSVAPREDFDFCISLDKYLQVSDDQDYEVEYLYVSKIDYSDGSLWTDPFGIKFF